MPRPLLALATLSVIALYLIGQSENPPGFHFDEVSVAYNALSIARNGTDEHGRRFPLYFEAFGEYKNPVYIYLLSGVFRVVPPSNLVARRLSAVLGIGAALCIGFLAWKVTRDQKAAISTLVLFAVTPLFFDLSRLAFEAALFPLAVALFLLAARSAYESTRWSPGVVVALAVTLALVTYTYTAGRLLGPLFALVLLFFARRELIPRLILVWLLYGLTVVPLIAFSLSSPDALLSRARYLAPEAAGPLELLLTIAGNYILNLEPITFSLIANPNHIANSGGPVLLMTFPLAVAGIIVARRERWTWFILAATLVAVLPGAVTRDVHQPLRLSAYVELLIAASAPAIAKAFDPSPHRLRTAVRAMLVLALAQAAWYFFLFHTRTRERDPVFDVGAREVVEAALARPERPIYAKGHQYIHAYWYGALNGVDRSAFRRVARNQDPPRGALVIYEVRPPRGTTVIHSQGRFVAFLQP